METMEDMMDRSGVKSLYVLAGENEYLRRKHVEDILRLRLGNRELERLDADDSLQDLIENANMLSLFGTGKIILQNNPKWIASQDDWDDLFAWLDRPTPDITIVVTSIKPLDKRKKMVKQLLLKDVLIECHPQKSWELPGWIVKRFAERKKRIDAEAVEALLALVGENESLLDNEILKLCLYARDEKAITIEMVESLSSASAEAGIFELIDALMRQDGVVCLKKLDNLIKMKEPEVKINFMLARQFRLLWQGKQLKDAGTPYAEIIKTMKVNPYVWKKTEPYVLRYDMHVLQRFFEESHQLDMDIKRGMGEPRVLLERFILDFCTQ